MLAGIDIAIVLAFLVYAASAGLRSRAVSSQNLEEYFLAGRTLKGWQAGTSMAATQFAADTPLLVTGMIATAGIFSLWRLWIYAIAFLLMGFVLGAAWRKAGVLTDAELAEFRYGGSLAAPLRAAKAIYFGTIFNCTVMAMVLFAATRIAEPFLPWDRWLPPDIHGVAVGLVQTLGLTLTSATSNVAVLSANNLISLLVILGVTLLYSTTGGLRAVVRTDVVQLGLAMVATFAYAWIAVDAAGGLGALPEKLTALYGDGRLGIGVEELLSFTPGWAESAGFAVLGTMAIQWFAQMNADGTGYLAQRTMACRTTRDARHAAIWFTVIQIFLRSLLWVAIGLALLVIVPAGAGVGDPAFVAGRESSFVTGIAELLPPGVKGLMLAALLAALASTLDTHLNWGASYWTNDLYKRFWCEARGREASSRSQVRVARLSNLVILVLALVILTRLDSIQTAWQTSLLLGAGMGVPLLLRWFWWRMTATAELGAIVASTVLAPVLLFALDGDAERMLVMTALSAFVAVAIARFGPAEPAAKLDAFYRRVHPPGFWGPVAARCGHAPSHPRSKLKDGLVLTFGSALALFCALVGVGSLLFGSPAPVFFPWRAGWIGLLFVAAVGLVIWLRRRHGRTRAAKEHHEAEAIASCVISAGRRR
ncbi:sodium:solute symporter family protein [Vulgatibacter sp.]|uniref:sodium:solute symporter family protein n=1 Tax=Vulgatibacter sp. TaxID=1971226 RepID=UPI003563544E